MPFPRLYMLFVLALVACKAGQAGECQQASQHPEWIFCDDFESAAPLVGQGRYFEYNNNAGDFVVAPGVGREGSKGMRARWQAGEVEAGNLKVAFGRNPSAGMMKGIRPGQDFREVYYRQYVRMQQGWKGDPYKLSRATVVARSDWSQAMIAHLWGDRSERLQLDPVRCVDGSGLVKCAGYNDFNHMEWIGAKAGVTPVFSPVHSNKWVCVEVRVKLNDPGQSNGIHEFWLDDKLEARREGLNFVGSYKDYGINAVFLENHWNSGSPQLQERYFDNFVISTQRIGCADAPPTGTTPTPGPTPDQSRILENPAIKRMISLGAVWLSSPSKAAALMSQVDGRVVPESGAAGDAPAGAAGVYVGQPDNR